VSKPVNRRSPQRLEAVSLGVGALGRQGSRRRAKASCWRRRRAGG